MRNIYLQSSIRCCTGLLNIENDSTSLKIMTRMALNSKIDRLFEELKQTFIDIFSKINYIGLTADIWSCKQRSFMGVTAHWIDPITLKRHSAVISCQRFPFPHTNERIAEHLQVLCDSYGITEKIVATTTDNASNFVKAFREFGLSFDWYLSEDKELHELSEQIEYTEIDTPLSMQVRCGSHTFNLIGVTDAANAMTNTKYFNQHSSAFKKLNRLWKCSSHPKASEKIVEILGRAIHRPVATRWNSVYDCVKKILKFDTEKLADLMKELEIPDFLPNDLHFLHEYLKVLKPVAQAIDILQAECNFALLLPIVHNTRQDLIQMRDENLKFTQPLLDAILDGIENRFGHLFDFDDERCQPALIATCTHPYFKTRWLTGAMRTPENLEKIRRLLIKASGAITKQTKTLDKTTGSLEGNQRN